MGSDDEKIDPEAQEIIAAERGLRRQAQQAAAATRKQRERLARKALEAIRTQDERAFATYLREADVTDGSDEWKRAWNVLRKGGGL